MKVLHISTSDRIGGAAIAAYRMNEAMNSNCIESRLLVMNKITTDLTVLSITDYKRKSSKFFYSLYYPLSFYLKRKLLLPHGLFSLGFLHSYHLTLLEEVQNADIIYIHWVNNFFLGIKELKRLLELGKPIIFFMHDMWLLTGGCHHAFSCTGFQYSCTKCPNIRRKSLKIIAKYGLQGKKRITRFNNLFIMCPSQWMSECVEKSVLFKNKERIVVPNMLNTSRFSFIDKTIAREILGLPLDKKMILFAADGGTANIYKGWHFLKESLKLINESEVGLVILGNHLSYEECSELPYPVYSLGKISDEYTLPLLYNAVDIYVTSSLVEAFGQTIVEAQSCGTLVVGFNIGGIPDIITHKKTGYLAQPGSAEDLKNGICWALDNYDNEEMKIALRTSVKSKFSYKTVVKQHTDFWSKIID